MENRKSRALNILIPILLLFFFIEINGLIFLLLVNAGFEKLFEELRGDYWVIALLTSPYLKIFAITGLLLSIVFLIAGIILSKKGDKYLIQTKKAVLAIIILIIFDILTVPVFITLLYLPMFNIVNLIKE